MSKEKQIEEMARDIPQRIVAYDRDPNGQYLYTEQRLEIAETLVNAGYRKQSEGKWIPKPHISRSPRGRYISYNTYSCDVCGKPNGRQKTPFCPHCGAKMKGGDKE